MSYSLGELRDQLLARQTVHAEKKPNLVVLKRELSDLTKNTSRENIHNIMDKKREISRSRVEERKTPYDAMVACLVPRANSTALHHKQNIIYKMIFNESSLRLVTCDSDRVCPSCDKVYVVSQRRAVQSCPGCGHTTRRYESIQENQFLDELHVKQVYKRIPLYRRFLLQYNTDEPDIPAEVYDVILKGLFQCHVFTRAKCKPTPITHILRKHKLSKWIPYALKISRTLNSEDPIEYLPDNVIDTLLSRFEEIVNVFEVGAKGKFLNYEFLTHMMLLMDGKTQYTPMFGCHKTANVYTRSMGRLQQLCAKLKELPTTKHSWDLPTS